VTRKFKPIVIPNRKIAPLDIGDEQFRLRGNELFMFDLWAQETNRTWGIPIDYYFLNVEKSTRDPLYDEPTSRNFSRAYKLEAWVQMPTQNPIASEEGFRIHFDGSMWIARKDLEEIKAPCAPQEGDVIGFWDNPQFNADAAANNPNIPNSGYYFDVTNAVPDGHLFDTPTFVGYKLTIKRRSEFGAERKILPP